ncbi:MAG: redoxin domain-containing protein [Ferruginibacter sp.]|nr:redoxin domain-containing protein [Cytophagales bacterium]
MVIILFTSIGYLFWRQEMRYWLPTPIPPHYQSVAVGQVVSAPDLTRSGKPVLLHFFNPDCPCSRFNTEQFQSLAKQYGDQVQFYAVLPETTASPGAVAERFAITVPMLVDSEKRLAKACGVYSTPQAALLDRTGKLYFRGNYNQSRYCTAEKTAFVKMALASLVAGQPAPLLGLAATDSYGCQLSETTREWSGLPLKLE